MIKLAATLFTLLLLTACGNDFVPNEKSMVTPYGQVAFPQNCPDWSHSPVINYDNSHHSNYGCATAYNEGYMVKNHDDLLQGRGKGGVAQTDSAVRAVERYYAGERTPDAQPEGASQ